MKPAANVMVVSHKVHVGGGEVKVALDSHSKARLLRSKAVAIHIHAHRWE